MLPLVALLSSALAQGTVPTENPEWRNADLVVNAHVDATPAQLYDYMLDLHHHRDTWSDACASDWMFGEVTIGRGAAAQVTYNAAAMHRKLTATLSRVTENRRIDVDHAGKKGFVTTWRFVENPNGGSEVELHTWLNAPPWPFRKYYSNKVQPAWQKCHQEAMDNLRKAAREFGATP